MKVWSWRDAIRQSDLQPTTKLVLYTISVYMNEIGGGAFPSYNRLACDCGLKRRSVMNHIQTAVERGYLSKSGNRRHDGSFTTNTYTASYPEGVHVDTPGGAPEYTRVVHGDAPGGCTTVHQGGASTCTPINTPLNTPDDNNPPTPLKGDTPQKKRRATFQKPTVKEVEAYCNYRGNNVDAEAFWSFYESNGWKVGKNKMKDWKRAVITWEKRKDEQRNNQNSRQPASSQGQGRNRKKAGLASAMCGALSDIEAQQRRQSDDWEPEF